MYSKVLLSTFLILLSTLLSTQNIEAMSGPRVTTVSSKELNAIDYSGGITFSLPVNWSLTPKLSLQIVVPPGYEALQPLDTLSNSNAGMLEFIPKGEDPYEWNNIITVLKEVKQGLSASQWTALVKHGLIAKSPESKILFEETINNTDYQQSSFIMKYTYKNRWEVIGVIYYSGPYDCAGLQYTIRPRKDQTIEDVQKIIQNFFKSNISITKL